MRFIQCGLLSMVIFLTGCDCTPSWDGTCHKKGSTYDPYYEQYQAYEQEREKKIVPGLGGALYNNR